MEILQEFNIRVHRVIEARHSNIVLIDKKSQDMFIIDVAIPVDFLVRNKEAEEISIYQNLALEISRMQNTKTIVIPIMIGSLLAQSLLTEYLTLIGVMTSNGDSMQQTAVLGLAGILQKGVSTKAYWYQADGKSKPPG